MPRDYSGTYDKDEFDATASVLSDGVPEAQVESITTEGAVIDDIYHYAAFYDGADADARLDNAISAAGQGDRIYLETATYTADRTITASGLRGLKLIGSGMGVGGYGTDIDASWTISTIRVGLEGVRINTSASGSLQFDSNDGIIDKCQGSLTVGGNNVRVLNGYTFGGTITFESSTSGGLVDGYVGGTSVTDNGTNSVGDVV